MICRKGLQVNKNNCERCLLKSSCHELKSFAREHHDDDWLETVMVAEAAVELAGSMSDDACGSCSSDSSGSFDGGGGDFGGGGASGDF